MSWSARTRAAVVRESVRTNLWPVPAAAVVVAVLGGVGLTRLDRRVDGSLGSGVTAYLFDGGPDAARSVLVAISGSLITVTSLTFSLTVVTLQLASSQFSPRLLRTFARDRFVHGTLALFLATFVYSVTVLRVVRTETSGGPAFVPQISVTVAYVLALASVAGLVLFLAHLAREIRVETMLRRVHAEANGTITAVTEPREAEQPRTELPDVPPDAVVLRAPASGFVTHVDEGELRGVLDGTGTTARIDVEPGDLVVEGTPVGAIWRRGGAEDGRGGELGDLATKAVATLGTGYERTSAQDVSFALRQLVDVATKAVSPGINDPTTAVHALGHVGGVLAALAGRALGPKPLHEPDGSVCAVLSRPTLADLLDVGINAPRRYGAGDREVAAQLYRVLAAVACFVHADDDAAAVETERGRLDAAVASHTYDPDDRAVLAAESQAVTAALLRSGAAPSFTPSV